MLTVVTLLLLPVVLAMAIFRIVQVPREFMSRRLCINPRAFWAGALGFGSTYCVLLAYTILVLCTAASAIINPPQTFPELLSVASVAVAHPFVYLAFEWVRYYSVKSIECAKWKPL